MCGRASVEVYVSSTSETVPEVQGKRRRSEGEEMPIPTVLYTGFVGGRVKRL